MLLLKSFAQVVELVDTPDLGSGAERCGGSSPLLGIPNLSFAVSAAKENALDQYFNEKDKPIRQIKKTISWLRGP